MIQTYIDTTQEWKHQLRSSLHPALFALAYYAVDKPMELLGFFPQFRAMIIVLLPNLVQAYFAATADYYTWQLSERLYGTGSNAALSAVSFQRPNMFELKLTFTALHDSSQPLAMVLLYKDIFK